MSAAKVLSAQLQQCERKVILVVIWIPLNRILKNVNRLFGIALMRIYVTYQSKISVILLPGGGNRMGGIEGFGIEALAKIDVGQIELDVIGIRVGMQGILEVTNGFVVKMISGQQYSNAGLGAIVAGAYLIKLRDGFFGLIMFTEFEIGFGKQVKVLRLARMSFGFEP